jgi:xylulokinase
VSGPYVIGCDVGSQGTNAALYSVDGTLVASAYEPHRLAFPRPAWAEQDPEDWTRALHATIARLVKTVPGGPSAVKALSFGSQLDGIVICDSRGRPLRPALIWMDRRAEAEAAALAEQISPADFYHHVGVNLDSSHAAFKAMWVREQEPEIFAQAARVMPPGSYVAAKAAGVLAADFSNASSLALLDPRSLTWSQPVLDLVGLDPGLLPELAPSIQPTGKVDAAFADATGLSPDTMVVLGCGDEMAATLGAGVYTAGEVCDVVRAAQRGPDDACRMPPARRSRRVAAREPGIRLRREPEVVA